jgi:hypothetical protein
VVQEPTVKPAIIAKFGPKGKPVNCHNR